MLGEMGCYLIQGYLFSKPLPPDGIETLLDGRAHEVSRKMSLPRPSVPMALGRGAAASDLPCAFAFSDMQELSMEQGVGFGLLEEPIAIPTGG